jgi:DNA-binding transcriptional ArsR family regulator
MFEFMNIAKALADENRVRILMALDGRDELCVCQLTDMLELAPSTVSKHLFILRSARLILGRKDGRWVYYRLNIDEASNVVKNALAWVHQSVSDVSLIQQDQLKLTSYLSNASKNKC